MLNCAITGCNSQEKFLRSGTLQMLDYLDNKRSGKRIVWFCSECSKKYTVQSWRPAGEQIQPRNPDSALSLADVFPSHIRPAGALSSSGQYPAI